MRKTIDAFATTAYRLRLGIQWRDRVSNSDVLKMVGRDQLMMTVVKIQLRKLGHNLRKNCTTTYHTGMPCTCRCMESEKDDGRVCSTCSK